MTRKNVEIDIDDRELRRELNATREDLKEAARDALPKIGQLGVGIMKTVAKEEFKAPRGHLAGSIQATRGHDQVDIGPDVPYAHWVDDGRGPVRAKNAEYLVFPIRNQSGSIESWVRTKEVAAFEGHDYTGKTWDRLEPQVTPLLARSLQAVMR